MTLLRKQKGGLSNWRMTWWKAHLHGRVILSVAVLALAVGLLPLASCSSGESSSGESSWPAFVYNSSMSLQAYEIAAQIPQVLTVMPCHCNCGEAHGHKSLKDCFFKADGSLNDHAAFCEICDMEAIDIAEWRKQRYSLEDIRAGIEAKYSRYGEPTDTPPFGQSETSLTLTLEE